MTEGRVLSSPAQVAAGIQAVALQLGTTRFTSGDCHVLAAALASVFRDGSVWACERLQLDENGACFSATYSHMLFESKDGTNWDIDGPDADERWVASFPEGPDKDGLTNAFEWQKICGRDIAKATAQWVSEHRGAFSWKLFNEVQDLLGEVVQAPVVLKPF